MSKNKTDRELLNISERCYSEVYQEFNYAELNIKKEIFAYFSKYFIEDENNYHYAMFKLSFEEEQNFKFEIERYLNGINLKSYNNEWLDILYQVLRARNLTREFAMYLNVRSCIEDLYWNYEMIMKNNGSKLMKESFENSALEIIEAFTADKYKIKSEFLENEEVKEKFDKWWQKEENEIKEILKSNKNYMINEIYEEIEHCLIRGDSPKKFESKLQEIINSAKSKAKGTTTDITVKLINKGILLSLELLEIKNYKIYEEGDNKTCSTCGQNDGIIVKTNEYEQGKTAPPFHINCRGVIKACIQDEDESNIWKYSETAAKRKKLYEDYIANATDEFLKCYNDAVNKKDIIKSGVPQKGIEYKISVFENLKKEKENSDFVEQDVKNTKRDLIKESNKKKSDTDIETVPLSYTGDNENNINSTNSQDSNEMLEENNFIKKTDNDDNDEKIYKVEFQSDDMYSGNNIETTTDNLNNKEMLLSEATELYDLEIEFEDTKYKSLITVTYKKKSIVLKQEYLYNFRNSTDNRLFYINDNNKAVINIDRLEQAFIDCYGKEYSFYNTEENTENTGDYYSGQSTDWLTFNDALRLIENGQASNAIIKAYENYIYNINEIEKHNTGVYKNGVTEDEEKIKEGANTIFINGITIINRQGKVPYNLGILGVNNLGYNACEVIAVYNALVKLGKKPDFYKLLFEFEVNGLILPELSAINKKGAFGSNPYLIKNCFESYGIEYKRTKEISDIIDYFKKGGKAAVISYVNNGFLEMSIHTICITYRNNIYAAYNNSNKYESLGYLSIEELLDETNGLITAYLLY